MNIILHAYKPYKKGRSYLTIAFFTYLKYDAMTMLDNAAKKLDYHLYTKPRQDEQQKVSSDRKGKKNFRSQV